MEKEKINSENELRKERKKNQSLMIIIIILLLAILAMLAAIFVPTLIDKPQSETEGQKVVSKEIKDIDVLTELSTKIDSLLGSSEMQYKQSSKDYGFQYGYEILKNGITSEVKQRTVLKQIDWSTMNQEVWQKAKTNEFISKLIPSYTEKYTYESTKYVSLEKVNAYSKRLFGEKLTNISKEISACPTYLYDQKNEMFYYPAPQCGGTSAEQIRTYKSKFEEKEDEAYVYVSFAFISPSISGEELDYSDYNVYKDFDIVKEDGYYITKHKNIYKSGIKGYQRDSFILDETNYKDFSEYKFSFNKDKNNNYYFVNIEQIK